MAQGILGQVQLLGCHGPQELFRTRRQVIGDLGGIVVGNAL